MASCFSQSHSIVIIICPNFLGWLRSWVRGKVSLIPPFCRYCSPSIVRLVWNLKILRKKLRCIRFASFRRVCYKEDIVFSLRDRVNSRKVACHWMFDVCFVLIRWLYLHFFIIKRFHLWGILAWGLKIDVTLLARCAYFTGIHYWIPVVFLLRINMTLFVGCRFLEELCGLF